ncbi:hypothetical protein RHSIM_Rhsim07G0041600 [Rhododendron simsii]|uniref:DUF4220 domain-containing protein n=1 Tax=Rhododendron simsii TaxID=118357 RepID=A0A834GSJ1_RHOSS|nr:hypothetical protein RHSIM_Rhsim07G0041600 [Rhododendron simsii]
MREANLPTTVKSVQFPPKKFNPQSPSLRDVELVFDNDQLLDEKSLLQLALCFYNTFKGLFFGGVSYSHEQRQFTCNFFPKRSSHDAFKLAEIELRFIHKDLHTKTGTPRLDGNPVACMMTLLLSVPQLSNSIETTIDAERGLETRKNSHHRARLGVFEGQDLYRAENKIKASVEHRNCNKDMFTKGRLDSRAKILL